METWDKKSSFTVWKQVLGISWEKLLHRTLWSNVLQEAQAGKGKIHKYWPVPESSHPVPESVISLTSPWDRDLSEQHKNCFWSLSQGVSDGNYKSTRQQRGWENKSTYQIPKYMKKANTKKVTLKNQQSIHLLLVVQLLPTLCDPMDYGPPGSSVRGILPPRILEWVAIPFFRGSSQLRDQTWLSYIVGRFFTTESPNQERFGNSRWHFWSS